MPSSPPLLTSKIVRAGAGAGKTTSLTRFVIDSAVEFKKKHGRYPQIAVTTFTRKATQELRERLVRLGFASEDASLIQFLSSPSQTWISTIHGVFSLFLRRYGHLLDLDPHFNILSSTEELKLVKSALRDTLIEYPDSQQWLEIFQMRGLTELTIKFGRQLRSNKKLRPVYLDDLQASFQQSVIALHDQCQNLLQDLLQFPQETKFIEVAQELCRCSKLLTNINEKNFTVQVRSLAAHIPRKPAYREQKTQLPKVLDLKLSQLLSLIKDTLTPEVPPEQWVQRVEQTAKLDQFLRQTCLRIEHNKQKKALLAMDDLELKCLEVANDQPGLMAAFADSFDLWLIDEFQDTSPVQLQVLRALMADRARFVVGDPQQSIYLFRGARSEIFHEYSAELLDQSAQRVELNKNYRSRPNLMLFFNDVFKRFGFLPMTPKDSTGDDSSVVASISHLADDEQETQAVVARLKILLHQGARFQDLCVLGRTNAELKKLALAVSQAGLPVHIHQTQGFFERREICEALAILSFLAHPYDNENLIQLLRSPWLGVADTTLVKALAHRPRHYYLTLLQSLPLEPGIQRLQTLREKAVSQGFALAFQWALDSWGFFERALREDPTGRMEANLWKLIERLRAEIQRPGFSLIRFIKEDAQNVSTDGSDDGDAVSSLEPNRINFMTVHAAKGLEFDHVLLTRMGQRPRLQGLSTILFDEQNNFWTVPWPVEPESGLKPTWTEKNILAALQQRETEEHARVFYVALTRARQSVHLFFSGSAQARSWAEHIEKFWLRDSGIHHETGYSFEVLNQPIDSQFKSLDVSGCPQVRKPWAEQAAKIRSDRHSVTSLVRSSNPKAFDLQSLKKAQRGVDIHRCLERLADAELDTQKLTPEMYSAVRYVCNLTEPPLLDLIKNGQTEWGFQIQSPFGLIEGQMDVTGDVQGQRWIVDYKTGSSRSVEQAFSQLQIYGWCLEQMIKHQNIRLAVVYPLEKKTITIDYQPAVAREIFSRQSLDSTGASD